MPPPTTSITLILNLKRYETGGTAQKQMEKKKVGVVPRMNWLHASTMIRSDSSPSTEHSSRLYYPLLPDEIRLIKLLPGKWDDDIYCLLYSAVLSDSLQYKSLSYVWGSPKNQRPICVYNQDKASVAVKTVTVNLECALRRLRKSDHTLTIWVDAICIDQSNLTERTRQIQLMRRIFASSEEVIVCLGEVPSPGFANSFKDTLMDVTFAPTVVFHHDDRDIGSIQSFRKRCISEDGHRTKRSRVDINYGFEVFCFIRLLADGSELDRIPLFDVESRPNINTRYQEHLFESLRLLMRSRWWNRIWVIQEIVVPENVTVCYGSIVAPWDMFVKAALSYMHSYYSPVLSSFPHEYTCVLTLFSRTILDIYHMRELWRKDEHTALLPLLRQFSGRRATDDRDKIYALLGLAKDQPSIVPDYSLPVSKVFQNAVLDIIERTGSLAALTGDLNRKDRQHLPSWVPDWGAAYGNLDHLPVQNTEHYDTTLGSVVYVHYQASKEWSGIREYLRRLLAEHNQKNGTSLALSSLEDYSTILGTSLWVDWLQDPDRQRSDGECLEAIENFYAANGGPVRLQYHGWGLLSMPGLHIDTVAATGEAMFSHSDLISTVQSWGILAAEHFSRQNYYHSYQSLGNAFQRTLCADVIQVTTQTGGSLHRRICVTDHDAIATWFLQGDDSPYGPKQVAQLQKVLFARDSLFHDVSVFNCNVPMGQSPSIGAAIRSATYRRMFFITKGGYIGLGPSQMRVGDHLYALLGSNRPFILRGDGSRDVRLYFEVIGDCYAHGLMDGEAMQGWRGTAFEMLKDLPRAVEPLQEKWRETGKKLQRAKRQLWKAEKKWHETEEKLQKAEPRETEEKLQETKLNLWEAEEKWYETKENLQKAELQKAEEKLWEAEVAVELELLKTELLEAEGKLLKAELELWKAEVETTEKLRVAELEVQKAEENWKMQEAKLNLREAEEKGCETKVKPWKTELQKALEKLQKAEKEWEKARQKQPETTAQAEERLQEAKEEWQKAKLNLHEVGEQWRKAELKLQEAEKEWQKAKLKPQEAEKEWKKTKLNLQKTFSFTEVKTEEKLLKTQLKIAAKKKELWIAKLEVKKIEKIWKLHEARLKLPEAKIQIVQRMQAVRLEVQEAVKKLEGTKMTLPFYIRTQAKLAEKRAKLLMNDVRHEFEGTECAKAAHAKVAYIYLV